MKGRNEPFAFVTQITETGVVIATDREGGRQFVLDWRGFEAGTAPAFARLSAAGQEGQAGREAEKRSAVFVHPLAITPAARARLNIGPLQPPATGDRPFHMTFDRAVWDASRAINPPGQSEWPASEHYSDLAQLWAAGRTFPLVYTDGGVNANAQATLTLVPRRHR